jgi:hypothetical protein
MYSLPLAVSGTMCWYPAALSCDLLTRVLNVSNVQAVVTVADILRTVNTQ